LIREAQEYGADAIVGLEFELDLVRQRPPAAGPSCARAGRTVFERESALCRVVIASEVFSLER
jgi:hypothetical protein